MSGRNKKGFTLVEMIVVIIIVGIIAAIGVVLILSAADALSFLTVRTDMGQSADVGLSRMSQEIRRIKDDTSIYLANQGLFAFIDVDGALIAYGKVGSDLVRYPGMPTPDILSSNVNSLIFTYYDDDGNVLADPTYGLGVLTNIRRIEVSLVFQIGSSYTFNYNSQIRPRNLRHLSYKFP